MYLVLSKQLKHVLFEVIVKASSGPRYVVACRSKVDKEKLIAGTRVVLDMTTLTIMRTLPREVYVCYRLFCLRVLCPFDYIFKCSLCGRCLFANLIVWTIITGVGVDGIDGLVAGFPWWAMC